MDECSMNLASCPEHASCVNLPGTYFCNCTQGYAPIGHPLEKCVDINECKLNIHTCEKDQMCQNTMGSYNCVDKCSEGYEYSNGECVDINECRFEHICDPRAECINLPGTYKCECEPGMKGDGKYCKPILDCTQDDSICDRHAVCLPFAKMCMCTGGYTGDGISCHDINECEAKENPCEGQPEKRCVNTKGGYICCNAEMDDERCIKDQGAFCAGGCGLNAVCMNKTCQCLEGFVGNANTRCIDINECESDKMCPGVGQWCVNVLGGHVCCGPDSKEPECQGVHIFKTTDGEVILHHNASQDVSFIAGGSARQVASGGEIAIVTGKGDPKKWLIKNGNLPSIHITSKDELKCTQYCPLNSECIDGFCKCSTGYGGNPLFGCEDVDECLSQPCNVTAGEWCVNTIGSFYCCNPSNATDTDCYGLEISSNKGIVVIGGTGDATNETLLAAKEKVNGGGVLSEEEHNIRNISEGLIVLTSDKVGSGETIAQLKAKKNLFGVELIDIPWEANGKRNFTFEEFSLLTTDAPVDTKTGKTNNVHIEVESHEGAKSGSAQSGGQGSGSGSDASGSSGSSQQSSTSVSSSSSEPRSHGVKTSNANEVPLSGKENKIHIEVESHEGKGSNQQQSSSSGSQKDGAASLSQKSESSGSGAHSGDSSSHGSEASQSSSGSGSASSHSGSSSSSKQKGSSKSSSKNKVCPRRRARLRLVPLLLLLPLQLHSLDSINLEISKEHFKDFKEMALLLA
ncbi:hypothetical protein WR25_26122 [Diploscapter pachys]|uniref:EGF-like domain-containing protein n=1 Tax=Diploscapter pachys TaxID=2018661 RepID=A0A2A2J611_9BILA|nr:hypothetical protein WR25_26122 [Diploscapter pachys]